MSMTFEKVEERVWPFLLGVAATFIVFVAVTAGFYDRGYDHGRQYEQKQAIDAGVAIERDDGSIKYLNNSLRRMSW